MIVWLLLLICVAWSLSPNWRRRVSFRVRNWLAQRHGEVDRQLRQRRLAEARQRQQEQQRAVLVQALRQLSRAPDFRRAASLAQQCHEVPAPMRQRLFQAYRPQLVRHYAHCLEETGDSDELLAGARTLVAALGIAPFEAEYIALEARRSLSSDSSRQPSAPASFAERLEQLQAEHESRVQALRANVQDEDLQEQLIEAEVSRFRERLLDSPGSATPAGDTP